MNPISKLREMTGAPSSLMRAMFALALGAGGAKLLAIAALPILTRIYAPESFGQLSLLTATVLVLAPFLSLGYSAALPIPRGNLAAKRLLTLFLWVVASLGAIGTILVLLFPPPSPTTSLGSLWWPVILLGAVFFELFEGFTLWAARQRLYRLVAGINLTHALVSESTKLALGVLGLLNFGLIIGHVSGLVSSGLVAYMYSRNALVSPFSSGLPKRLWHIARLYSRFPIYRLPSHALVLLSLQAPVFIVSFLYSISQAGQLSLALMSLSLPANLLGESLAKAYYSEASRRPKSQLRGLTLKVIKHLAVVATVPALVLAMLGPFLFRTFFGQEWALAGEIAVALSIYLIFQFCQKPLPYYLYLEGKQRLLLFINIQRLLVTIGSISIPFYLGANVQTAILIYAVSLSVHQIAAIRFSLGGRSS